MLRIVVNDQDVDLEGVKFNLQLNSPIPFNPEDGMVEGSFAFGVNFPASNRNRLIFGHPDRLELYPESEKDFPGLLYFDGILLFKIVITLTNPSEYTFRANIKVDLGYYANQLGEKTLRDLEYEGTVTLGDDTQDIIDHANDVVTKSFPQVKYNFPQVYHPNFYGEEKKMNPSWQDRVNNYIHGTGFRANSIDNDHEIHNYYNLVPFPYLIYVLQKCYSEFGYLPSGPVTQDPEIRKLLIYNNFALDEIKDRYKSLVTLTNDQPIIDVLSIVEFDRVDLNIDDPWQQSHFWYNVLQSGQHIFKGHMIFDIPDTLPLTAQYDIHIYLDEVSIGYFWGYIPWDETVEVDFNLSVLITSADIGKKITLRVFIYEEDLTWYPGNVKAGSWFSIQNGTWSNYNGYAMTVNIANHVPDIKISTFLISLLKSFGIVHQFATGTRDVYLYYLKDILADTREEDYTGTAIRSTRVAGFRENRSYKLSYTWNADDEYTKDNFLPWDPNKMIGTFNTFADLPELSNEGDQAIIRNLHSVYRFETDAWVWFTDLHYPMNIGNGSTPVTIDWSPLMMYDNRDNPAVPKVYPKILQEGSSLNLGRKDHGFHLVIFYGLQADDNGNTYPFASCTKYSPTGTIIGNYELVIDSAEGLYETFLSAYYNFVMNRVRPLECDRLFTTSEIKALSFVMKKRLFQHVFLLQEVNIPINNTSLGIASIKLQKI